MGSSRVCWCMVTAMAKKTAKRKTASGSPKAEQDSSIITTPDAPSRITRHVRPMGPRVLVRVLKSGDRLDSGLYLPKGAKDDASEAVLAEVLEVARTMPDTVIYYDDDEDGVGHLDGENVSGIPINSKVLFAKERGTRIPWDDTLRLLHVRHILAIVDEIPEEQIQ